MPDPIVRTYDPKMIIVTFGEVEVTGFAAGTFLNVERSNGPSFEKERGADGSVDRVNKNARDLTVTLTLKQTSVSNAALSAIHSSDQLLNTGIRPLLIKDLMGTTLVSAPQAWIENDANIELADTLSGREWTIATGQAEKITGGNN